MTRTRLWAGAATTAAAVLAATPVAPVAHGATGLGSLGMPGFLDPAGSADALDPAGSAAALDPVGSLFPDFRPSLPGPDVAVESLADGLTIPWDVVRAPDGTILTGERDTGRLVAITPEGGESEVAADFDPVFDTGESGLMGMTLASDFEETRQLFTCVAQGGDINGVRVLRWHVADDYSELSSPEPVVEGIPMADNGLHSGCSLTTHPDDGSIFVGTGDAFTGSLPQDPDSLGGKILNINADGSSGPHAMADDTIVSTFGHRNVQGLAFQPETHQLYSAEHGPAYDDEINRHTVGGNYGWAPDEASDYDQNVPMTDLERFPDAVEAVFSSGQSRLAPAGAAFLDGSQWGEFDGALAVATLRAQQILLFQLSDDGEAVEETATIVVGDNGRLRSLTPEPGGDLLVTTSNGDGQDEVFRLTPA